MSLIELKGIKKSFYGVEVLHGVDLTLRPGTVHALMGENGAGKSTLMKVIAGVHKCDEGTILMDGKEVRINSPSEAQSLGIAMIHQELSPVREMTVAENIFLGREPSRMGFIDYRKLYAQTSDLLEKLRIPINPKSKMKSLRVADQQMVEIAKAISQNARIVIMDEPTSAITDNEVDSLFAMIEDMKAHDVGIIYISHKMGEIFRIADDITVLRDGTLVNTWPASEVDNDTLIKQMVGRELKEQFPKVAAPIGETVLEVKNLSLTGQYEDISFELHRGEILGLVGLVGAGRTEVMRSIFGMTQPEKGEILLNGKPVHMKSPADAIKKGIAYVTEDRKGEGLILPMSVFKNTTLSALKDFVKTGIIQDVKESKAVDEQVKALRIKVNNLKLPVKSLSGGNQQKVVLAKWMITGPDIMIFDEPTRGIDVGAKAEIYKIMCDYVAQGHAIIMISSEMPEAMGMSDRIIVLSNHKCSGELDRQEFSQEAIVQMQFKYM
ncbi:MAG: sugar ABC transporter ATP-binding protein [Parasporobacterium sp.]|nr:sugar ABC transporter ATP-binding protein [Parasporobacterium sp.]